jgi:hypothetical protein
MAAQHPVPKETTIYLGDAKYFRLSCARSSPSLCAALLISSKRTIKMLANVNGLPFVRSLEFLQQFFAASVSFRMHREAVLE